MGVFFVFADCYIRMLSVRGEVIPSVFFGRLPLSLSKTTPKTALGSFCHAVNCPSSRRCDLKRALIFELPSTGRQRIFSCRWGKIAW